MQEIFPRRDAETPSKRRGVLNPNTLRFLCAFAPLRGIIGRNSRGQAAIEFALLYAAVVLPLTFMIVFVSQMLWTWHSVVDFTRTVAQFAATHCWEPDNSGSNVLAWATTHVPPMIDRGQFQSNAAGITVAYFSQAADGTQTPF